MKQYFVIFALIPVWLIGMARSAQAEATIRVPAEGLAAAVAEAQPGDTIEVTGGVMRGNLVLDKTLTIIGIDRPVIDAENKGTVVTITAPDTVLRGFTLRNSGDKLIGEDAGVNVGAAGALIEDNHIENVLFGIYVHSGPGTTLRGNIIDGKPLEAPPVKPPNALALTTEPQANVERYDALRKPREARHAS